MAVLIDTNVLVYRYDPRDTGKQRLAREYLRAGIQRGDLRVAHQAIVEFVSAVTRPLGKEPALLEPPAALREAEELLHEFPILYPNAEVVRGALRGMAAYQLSWFDAHMWAYADYFGLTELASEDFQEGRRYGTVLVVNPFAA